MSESYLVAIKRMLSHMDAGMIKLVYEFITRIYIK